MKGEVSIATTGAGDPAAFARVQAGTLDPTRALAEAYRRNNAGSYAEAANSSRPSPTWQGPLSRSEALANEALQKSNLGRYAEADSLFVRAAERARERSARRPPAAQLSRHARTQPRQCRRGAHELDKPMPSCRAGFERFGRRIGSVAANRLNSETKLGQQLNDQSDELLPAEKAEIWMAKRSSCAGHRSA